MTTFHYQMGDQVHTVQIERAGDAWHVTVNDQRYTVAVQRTEPHRMVLQIDGAQTTAVVATAGNGAGQRFYVWLDGDTWTLQRTSGRRGRQSVSQHDASGSIVAPMPGQVLALLVAAGDQVAQGDPLVVLGAMKMETRLTAPHAGVVKAVGCAVGDTVERGQLLIQFQ